MDSGNIRNYQVNYAITAEGNAAAFFKEMAESTEQMKGPLNALQSQINAISRSMQLLGKNENLKRLFALEPSLNLTQLKAGLAEAEKMVSQSAERMATQLNTALANAATLKQTKVQSAAKRSKAEIESMMRDLEKQFYKASGGRNIDDKKIKGRDDTTAEAWKLRGLYRNLKKELGSMTKMSNTASSVLGSVKRAEDITKTAAAIENLNSAVSKYNNRKAIKVKIDADVSKAIATFNGFLKKVQESVATVPLMIETPKKGKGKSSSKTSKNIVPATSETVTNLIKGKEKALSIRANFNGGDAAFQMQQSITRLQELAKTKPVIIRGIFNGGDAGFQLNQSIVNLQKLADSKPIIIRATTSAPTTPNTGVATNVAQTATVNDGKGSTQVSATSATSSSNKGTSSTASKWTATQSQINAYERHRASMADMRINNAVDVIKQRNKLAATNHVSNQTMYDQLFGRETMHQRWFERDAAGESTRARRNAARQAISDRAALNAAQYNARELARLREITAQQTFATPNEPTSRVMSTPTGRGGYSARFTQPKNDLYTRSRAFWYPFTGNTSFGARTPMAVDMAKGMGTMFAIGGAMSAVGSSLNQAVEYQNIMKTTNAILKNGTDNYSNGAFKGMEQIVRQVGKDTKFTAPQVASAAKFLAMAGYDIPAINSAIKPVSNIALIGDTDLGATADKLTNVMTTFGIAPEKMNDIADIMTTTFTRSNTDMMMLAESAKYAGGIANLYGGNFQNNFADVMAMFGALGNAGIQASSAGTTLRMMYQNLMQPNKNQRAALKQYGIYTRDTSGNPLEMVDILKQIAAKVPKDKLADAIGSMFRITAQPGAAALANSLKNGENSSLLKLMEANRTAAGTGIAENIANEKKNTISGLWAQVQSTFTEGVLQAFEGKEGGWAGMLIQLRDYLAQPETVDMLRSIVDMVENLAKIMGDFAKVYAKIYNMFPGIINGWIKFQLVATQFGYLVTPVIQLIGVLNMLKTAVLGTSATAATATITENTFKRARNGGAVASAISGFAPRYANYKQSGKAAANYAAYQSGMAYWLGKRTNMKNIANLHGGKAMSALKSMPDSTWWAIAAMNPQLASDIKSNPSSLGLQMYAQKYKGSIVAKEYGAATRAAQYAQFAEGRINATKSQYFENLRAVRRPGQMMNRSLIDRYAAMGGDAALIASARAQIAARDARIAPIAAARHASRGMVASDVRERFARMNGWKKAAGMSWKTSFSAGQALGTISMASMVGSLKNMALSLFSGLARAIGMLTSPVGLAVGALATLGFGIYKVYSDIKKRNEQLTLAKDNSNWVSNWENDVKRMYVDTGINVGGFSPVKVGYEKSVGNAQMAYSIGDNSIAKILLDEDKTDKLTGSQVLNNYVQKPKYLPQNIITDYQRSNKDYYIVRSDIFGASKHIDKNSRNKALQLAMTAQWAELATKQSDVRQAAQDLQKAMSDKDFKRAQDIVNVYKPTSSNYMSNMAGGAKAVSEITDPTKFYEWQYAQYKVLKDLQSDFMGPLQNYQKAIDMMSELKGMKKADLENYDATSLAQTIMKAIPISFNGTTAQITLDKMGRVDWMALANSVNNGIPFTIGEQQDILKNTYDAIYNDPNIQNFASVIDLLRTYLPQIANAKSPFDEYHWTGWGETVDNEKKQQNINNAVHVPFKPKPQKSTLGLFDWNSLPQIKTPQLISDYKEAQQKAGGDRMKTDALYIQNHPNLFPQSNANTNSHIANANKYTRNGTVGGTSGKNKNSQKEYANTYDRSAARPTQVVINIDKLANFDRTAITKNVDDRAIITMIEDKIAEAVAMLSSQALNSASSLIAQNI